MTYTRDLFPKFNFIYSLATGTVDDQTLMIHIMSIYAETVGYKVINELVDARNLHTVSALTVRGLIRAAETQQRLFPEKDFRAAVLVDTMESRKAVDIYAVLTNTANLQIKAFEGGMDEPLAWLGFNRSEADRIKQFIDRRMALQAIVPAASH